MNHRTLRAGSAAALTLVALAAAGCGDGDKPTAGANSAAPTPTTAGPSPSPSASPSPTVSPSPTFDPTAPLAMGKSFTTTEGAARATVYAYKHNVARSAPRPDEQPGYVWAAIGVKVCALRVDIAPQGISISNGPWTLVYADDTQIEASSVGYNQFPEPEYPFGEKAVAPGRCVRGWITYPVPGNKRPVAVEYAPAGEPIAPRWAVK